MGPPGLRPLPRTNKDLAMITTTILAIALLTQIPAASSAPQPPTHEELKERAQAERAQQIQKNKITSHARRAREAAAMMRDRSIRPIVRMPAGSARDAKTILRSMAGGSAPKPEPAPKQEPAPKPAAPKLEPPRSEPSASELSRSESPKPQYEPGTHVILFNDALPQVMVVTNFLWLTEFANLVVAGDHTGGNEMLKKHQIILIPN